ncbi:hypothetical protein ACSAZL_05085 [Methanosarcina sp. T3]|uniref:hypothetical protein n=1 Tax=Methanosarcina sp. T3 TaxID=3439062 RepID=UPI003F84B26A
MNWTRFRTYNEAPERAFEALCDQLFEKWSHREYGNKILCINVVNGAGGDGGVEAYTKLQTGEYIGLQAKWFPSSIEDTQIKQIQSSVKTAKKIRNNITKYIICIPRNLSDERMGKGQKKIINHERSRVENCFENIKKEYPEMVLELWDEKRLSTELQYPEAEGIRKFWFEREEISLESLKKRFELAKNGWLKERYVSSLHGSGYICNYISEMLGVFTYRQNLVFDLTQVETKIIKALSEIEHFLSLPNITTVYNHDELTKFERAKKVLMIYLQTCQYLIDATKYGAYIDPLKLEENAGFRELFDLLKNRSQWKYRITYRDLERALVDVNSPPFDYPDLATYFNEVSSSLASFNMIILGNPSTGKTHGLANYVENNLKENFPALLIRARDVRADEGWGSILRRSLELSGEWSTDEIWSGLEACASICDVRRALNEEFDSEIENETTRFLICIDGVDESTTWNSWIERVGELETINKWHPKLRFCFSSRPYVFKNEHVESDLNRLIYLPLEGDVSVNELFPAYVKHYNINVIQVNWVRWAIRDLLSLRLFCEEYSDCCLTPSHPIYTTVSSLLKSKIARVDKEICIMLGNRWGERDSVILRCLTSLAKFFLSTVEVSRNECCSLIKSSQGRTGLIDENTAGRILDCLVNYGLLYEYVLQSHDPLDPSEQKYQIAFNPLNDYLIAREEVKEIVSGRSIRQSSGLRDNYSSQQMAAVILLAENNWLVGDRDLWTDDLSKDTIADLRLSALSYASIETAAIYKGWVETKLRESMPSCRKTLKILVVRVARMENHPLGPKLVHDILTCFDDVASRDLIFSGPDYIPKNQDEVWEGYGRNPIRDLKLEKYDKFDGLPLLFTWTLTTVDNDLRLYCRKELTKWGTNNLDQLINLLNLTFGTDDPQMKEDLISVALGAACLVNQSDRELGRLAEWTINEIFEDEKIQSINNVVIRHAGRLIVERAFFCNFVSEEQVLKSRPPYKIKEKLLRLDEEAVQSQSETFTPVDMDLGWYVLKESYEGFFETDRELDNNSAHQNNEWENLSTELIKNLLEGTFGEIELSVENCLKEILENRERKKEEKTKLLEGTREEIELIINNLREKVSEEKKREKDEVKKVRDNTRNPEATELLNKYAASIGVENITPHQLALGASIRYIKNLGWNEKQFYGIPNGGEEGELLGADIAIIRKYPPATHGERSRISSFAEKYVWCAVHELIGYFSDILEYQNPYGSNKFKINDYSSIIYISNPAQELLEEDQDQNNELIGWFLPSDLCPKLEIYESDKKRNIVKWINEADIPPFSSWILPTIEDIKLINRNLDDLWTCLYNFTILTENETDAQSLLWISSYFTTENEFNFFKRECASRVSEIDSLLYMGGTYCTVEGHEFYSSPVDLLWIPWKREYRDQIDFWTIYEGKPFRYTISPAVLEGMYDSAKYGESTYYLPSKKVRNICSIMDGDNKRFCDKKGNLKGFNSSCGEKLKDNQYSLFVRRSCLESGLQKDGLKLFWLVKLIREQSPRAWYELDSFRFRRERVYLLWVENDEIESLPIKK